jgi:23S rRNA maturation-related 3'-5' exoribonuclease YhaM
MDKIKEFEKELKYIKNPAIRKFVETAIDSIPDYFFEVPASSTGKWHPEYALGNGGLLRHTRAAVRIAIELSKLEMFKYSNDEKDLIFASLILHDGWKSGETKSQYTLTEHPLIAKFALEKNESLKNIIPENYFATVLSNISCHMGEWNKDYKTGVEVLPKPATKMQNFVHICDYLASRKCLEMKFDVELSK